MHAPQLATGGHHDVICLGELMLAGRDLALSGAAARTAQALTVPGLAVGLCGTIPDDPAACLAVLRARKPGLAIEGIVHGEAPPQVPDAWTSDVLVISGVTPALVPAARFCREARAARRRGAMVVLDLNARREAWREHDGRTTHALIREAHVVRCSASDLLTLWMDLATLRRTVRADAIAIVTNGPYAAAAYGPFGDVTVAPPRTQRRPLAAGAGDAFTAAIVAELLRPQAALAWDRVLLRAHASAWAHGAR